MNTNDQLSLLRLTLGEPADAAQARFTPVQLLLMLIEGRRWTAEYTRSHQIRESQPTNPTGVPTKFYVTPLEFIGFYAVEWDGIPLEPVQPRDWRSRVGDDDDLTGTPVVYKYHVGQIQLFFVPDQQKTLRYEGWGYPAPIIIDGVDADFTDQQARVAIYRAAWLLKDADERDSTQEQKNALIMAEEIKKQFRPKGPRMVRTGAASPSVARRILNG